MGNLEDHLLAVATDADGDAHLGIAFGIDEGHHLVGMGRATARIEGRHGTEQRRVLFVEPLHHGRQHIINLVAFLVDGIAVGTHLILPRFIQEHLFMIRTHARLVLHIDDTDFLGLRAILAFRIARLGADLNLDALRSVGRITVTIVEFADHIKQDGRRRTNACQARTTLAVGVTHPHANDITIGEAHRPSVLETEAGARLPSHLRRR